MPKHGKSYIKVEGGGTFKIKAKTKEEATKKLMDELRERYAKSPTFEDKPELLDRWVRATAIKMTKTSNKPEGEDFSMKWKNSPSQKWLTDEYYR